MEFITVKYPESKRVLIDDEEAGSTNTTLRVDRGIHTFSIGEPKNYRTRLRFELCRSGGYFYIQREAGIEQDCGNKSRHYCTTKRHQDKQFNRRYQ